MLENYIYVLVFIGVGLLFGVLPLVLCFILAPRKYDSEKSSAFECGFEPFEDARLQIDVRFYLVAILFIIFDLEIMFLFPWSVVLGKISDTAFWAMGIFLLLLVIGFIYEWKKGALEWE